MVRIEEFQSGNFYSPKCHLNEVNLKRTSVWRHNIYYYWWYLILAPFRDLLRLVAVFSHHLRKHFVIITFFKRILQKIRFKLFTINDYKRDKGTSCFSQQLCTAYNVRIWCYLAITARKFFRFWIFISWAADISADRLLSRDHYHSLYWMLSFFFGVENM